MAEMVVSGCARVGMGLVNAYLLDTGGDKLVLVDAGWTHFFKGPFRRALAAVDRGPRDVGDIVITHQHIDHAGGLAKAADATGARVHVHSLDAPELEAGEHPRPGFGRTPFLRFVARGSRWQRLPAVPVDRKLGDGEHPIDGTDLIGIHTPGHTSGHMAYLWPAQGGLLFAGDLAANFRGKLGYAPVIADWEQARRALSRIVEYEFSIVALGHGPVLKGEGVSRFRRFAEEQAG